ncbi:hypothetical protein [Magnetococcus sp. PR-3]|uniref:hypothetical protein n=1 Tax=Magnetococcus sp. PR-3 TaxID=3120355 RepID=UPI002FCDE46F
MLIRLAIILVIVLAVGWFVLRLFGVKVSLSPSGKRTLLRGAFVAIRLLLRRMIGR